MMDPVRKPVENSGQLDLVFVVGMDTAVPRWSCPRK